VQTDPSYKPSEASVMPVHHGETGELLKNLPAPWSLRLKRKKWLEMISKDIDVKVSGSIILAKAQNYTNCCMFSGVNALSMSRPVRTVSQSLSRMEQQRRATCLSVQRELIQLLESFCWAQKKEHSSILHASPVSLLQSSAVRLPLLYVRSILGIQFPSTQMALSLG
jgi:hypothetical protein